MDPVSTFVFGLALLVLFFWYLATDLESRKRLLGTALTILTAGFCAICVYPPAQKINLGLDLQGGTSFLIKLVPVKEEDGTVRAIDPKMVDTAVEVIRRRVDQFGVSEPVITPQGTDRILVQIPGLDARKTEEARMQLQKVARLEFKMVHPESDRLVPAIEAGQEIIPPGYRIETYRDERENGRKIEEKLLVKARADLAGERVTRAWAFFDQQGYGVSLQFDAKGADLFGRLTAANVGNRFAIVLDGEIQSAPVIREAIYGGTAQITGNFDEVSARNLASVLQNPLATPVTIEEERSASATLGTDSIRSGVYAGLTGLVLVLLFVLAYYKLAGLIALVGLTVSIVFLFGAMSMFGFVLTLPGIAGIILTIGMAIDANVLIFERLREEMAAGKALGPAITAAYEKAFSAIFDSNVTTLITSIILFWQASGPVRGFAVTLTVGIIGSMFAAMIVTRVCFGWALHSGWLRRLSMFQLVPSDRHIDFLSKRRLWAGISVVAIVVSMAVFAVRGEKNFGVDFRGGDLLMVEATKQDITTKAAREALARLGLAEVTIQKEKQAGGEKEYLSIRSPFGTSETIKEALQKALPDAGLEVRAQDKVGSLVGGELAKSSLWALGLALAAILVYVTLRFEFSFALGAIVALIHDVIITIGIFAIAGRELSLIMVGAILTIAGYSINDTIIVFDRIREGLRSGRRGSIQDIMNASINETLSRTLLTSGTTLLSVAALYLFGGPVLRDFSFAILIGILVGTYSSIFIASPIVLWWSGKGGQRLKAEVKRAQALEAQSGA